MSDAISDLARRLAENAESVCRHYLSNGRRHGNYWIVGDVRNTPGRSLYVRLRGPLAGKGACGRWNDGATGEHGDLLDLIRAARDLDGIAATIGEARQFLGLPPGQPAAVAEPCRTPSPPAPPTSSQVAVRRLFESATPIAGTLAATYLAARSLALAPDMTALRFHPHCWYRPDPDSPPDAREHWPALIAAVTDLDGAITGLQRTWIDPSGTGKAPVETPRRALGQLAGNAVRFGAVNSDVMVAGEGIETMLSLRGALPTMPLAAALSAGHLAALILPATLRRLYVACDNDTAGRHAAARLIDVAKNTGIEVLTLAPILGDFNDDVLQLDRSDVAASIRAQLAPDDVARFWQPPQR